MVNKATILKLLVAAQCAMGNTQKKIEEFESEVNAWHLFMPPDMSDEAFVKAFVETMQRKCAHYMPTPTLVCETWKEQGMRSCPAPTPKAVPAPPLSLDEELARMRSHWVTFCQYKGQDPGDKYLSTPQNKADLMRSREIAKLRRLLNRPFRVGESQLEYNLQKEAIKKRIAELGGNRNRKSSPVVAKIQY